MFIPDGVNRDYSGKKGIFFSWGWIGNKVNKSESSWDSEDQISQFVSKISQVKKVDGYMGRHDCEICGEKMGSCSLKFKYGGKVYVSPDRVEHYILKHGYVPPKEVINSVFNGIDSEENKTYVKNHQNDL